MRRKTNGGGMAQSFAMTREQLDAMAAVADEAAGGAWKPAGEVLRRVRAVPTDLIAVDELTRVGGWPTERFSLIHGPSSQGKTQAMLLLGASFLKRGHFFDLIDAEYTTPITWCEELMTPEVAHLPTFRALRPQTYEEVRDAVRRKCDAVGEARAKGRLDPKTTGLIGLDSLRKLVPKKLYETLAKEMTDEKPKGFRKSPKGIDGYGGRAAQMKAALNASWLDELVPLLGQTGMAMAVISRETEDPDADPFDDDAVKVGGGKAVFYESSVALRCLLGGFIVDGDDKRLVGEKTICRLRKTKVGHRMQKVPEGFFHVSNGVLVPAGHDRARDVLELGRKLGSVVVSGAWWCTADGETIGQGINKAVVALHDNAELLAQLEAETRAMFVLEGTEGPASQVGEREVEHADGGSERPAHGRKDSGVPKVRRHKGGAAASGKSRARRKG